MLSIHQSKNINTNKLKTKLYSIIEDEKVYLINDDIIDILNYGCVFNNIYTECFRYDVAKSNKSITNGQKTIISFIYKNINKIKWKHKYKNFIRKYKGRMNNNISIYIKTIDSISFKLKIKIDKHKILYESNERNHIWNILIDDITTLIQQQISSKKTNTFKKNEDNIINHLKNI